MQDAVTDHDLLVEYARQGSEAAFATLVHRYVNLVYSVALRKTGDAQAAQEITQAAFIILAKKAGTLSRKVILSGWLCETARLTAANYLRSENRRLRREQEAYMQSRVNESEPAEAWRQMAPLLDDAIGRLNAKDRAALVLRYFENRSLREVGRAIGATEDAAKMRVNRALEKLRKLFGKRGVVLPATIIATALAANSVQAAPLGIAAHISTAAAATSATTSTLALVKGALKVMAWAKAKTAIVVGLGVVLLAGTTVLVESSTSPSLTTSPSNPSMPDTSWQVPRASLSALEKALPQTQIVPSKFKVNGGYYTRSSMGAIGIAQPVEKIAQVAYQADPLHPFALYMIKAPGLPDGKYDFISKLTDDERPQTYKPSSQASESERKERLRIAVEQNANALETWTERLQAKLRSVLGVTAHREMRRTNVLALRVQNPTAGGIKSLSDETYLLRPRNWEDLDGAYDLPGEIWFFDRPITDLIPFIERRLQIPVVDQTQLTNHYDFSVKWSETDRRNNTGMKKAILDQLGLELVPTNMPVEMLVVERLQR